MQPFAKEAAPIVQSQIRPFVRDARPVVRSTTKPANELAAATPDLTSSFTVLNHLFNLVGYNPNGREDPSKDGREEGYLFWIAWLQHNGASLFSTSDANGPFRAGDAGRHLRRRSSRSRARTRRSTRRCCPRSSTPRSAGRN